MPWSTPFDQSSHTRSRWAVDRLEVDAHLGHVVLHLGVVGHRAGQRDRRALVHAGDRLVERPLGDRRVDAGEAEQRPGEQRRRGTARRRRSRPGTPARSRSSGTNARSRIVSFDARRPHAERVPRLARCGSRACRGAGSRARPSGSSGSLVSMRVHAEVVHTGERLPKILWPVISQPPSTRSACDVDSSTGMSLPASPWPAAKTSPSAARVEHPVAGRVAGAVQVGAQPDEVEVHVDGDGGGRRDVGDAALQAVDLGRGRGRAPPNSVGQRGGEVAARPQLLEVLVEEAVLAVVARRPLVEAGEHLVGQRARPGR